jgi:ATP-dependent Lon protease
MSQDYLPLLPLRDVVVFPSMVIPLFVGRAKSIAALEEAMTQDKRVMLVAQKDAGHDNPDAEDLNQVGTVANILQLLKLPDGTVKVLVEGDYRAKLVELIDEDTLFRCQAESLVDPDLSERENEVLVRSLTGHFEQYVQLSKKVPSEVLSTISGIEDAGRLADTIAAHISLKLDEKQSVLEMINIRERIEHLMGVMESEIDLFKVEKRIRGRVKKQMEKSQREYYLNEQMKAIQKELGDMEDTPNEMEELQQKIIDSGMTKEAQDKTEAELKKLKMMSPMSAEASVVRGYIDWMVGIPWKKRSRISHDLKKAKAILDAEH